MGSPNSDNWNPDRSASTLPDYYGALGIAETATPDQIKRAYRAAMKRVHPDRASLEAKAESERMARFLNEAYRVLTDPAERRQYDTNRRSAAIQDEVMNRYFGGFGVPGGRNDVYEEILAVAREQNRQERRRNDRHATASLLRLFTVLLAVGIVLVLLWGIVASIVERFV
ncbi:MAG: J domain-containing protein [Thermomicrobiales bacterium]|nr:J domain-containing protein [Thermomicrobiales bacterium]